MAFAVDTSDRRTMFGTMALRPALQPAISTCATISRRRRSIASTIDPASSDPARTVPAAGADRAR
ncbi:MAG: hypothetical protein ACRDNT_22425 [Streptosporangiaceae bacterium]